MPIPSSIADISTTAASNYPAGGDAIGTSLDDYLRTIQSIIKQQDSKGSDIASSTTITAPNAGSYFVVTGTTTIATIADNWNGRQIALKFSGVLQLTHSSGLILPASANITTASGDCLLAVNESTGVWRVIGYQLANGKVIGLANVDNTSDATKNAATATLTNKRITARVGSTTSSATPTINTDNVDIYKLTAQTEAIASFTTNLSGTPVDGDVLVVQVTGTAARAITWGASFEASTIALPTTTVTTAMLTVGFLFNGVTSKWRCVAAI